MQVTDTSAIDAWVAAAIEQNPDAVASLKAGKAKAAGKLVGAVMQLSKGKANPALVNERIQALLKHHSG